MAKFIYTVYLPGLQKTVRLTELPYSYFKQLVKIITNDDNKLISVAFDDVIKQHCLDDVSCCSVFDKLLILLTIRAVCISPVLELVVSCPDTKESFNCNIEISDLKAKIENIGILTDIKTYDQLSLQYDVPRSLYITDTLDTIQTVIHSVTINNQTTYDIESIIDKLPASILRDAKTFLENIEKRLTGIELLVLTSPYSSSADPITITANIFNNSLLELLKICFKRDLLSIYEHEYFLMNQFRLQHETFDRITPAEISIYINLYKEEVKEREKAEKKDSIPLK
jgi:hypothetical protein